MLTKLSWSILPFITAIVLRLTVEDCKD